MTQFAIIRHGITDWNVAGRMQGHRDIPLNDIGILQASHIAERLQVEHWDMIVSSDLLRATQTALTIAKAIGITCESGDSRLRERHYGDLEGTTREERTTKWGNELNLLDYGVESEESLFDRALTCMEELACAYTNHNIVVVTHGGWIRQFFKGVFPNEMLEHPHNTSLSRVSRDIHGWRCLLYNCTMHLNSEG